MDIRVSGHQIDTGAALQEHVDDRLNSIVDKYFSRAISSHVTFGKGPGGSFTSDIVTKGLTAEIECEARDGEQIDRLVDNLRAKGYSVELAELA